MTVEQYDRLKEYKPAIKTFVEQGSFNEKDEGLISIYEEITNSTVNRSCAGCKSAAILGARQMIQEYEKGSM